MNDERWNLIQNIINNKMIRYISLTPSTTVTTPLHSKDHDDLSTPLSKNTIKVAVSVDPKSVVSADRDNGDGKLFIFFACIACSQFLVTTQEYN